MHKKGFYINCQECSKEVYRTPCEVNKKYCSIRCKSTFLNKKRGRCDGKIVKCSVCNKDKYFNPKDLLNRKNLDLFFCSISCRFAAQKSGLLKNGLEKPGKEPKDNNPYIVKQVNKIRQKEHREIMEKHIGRKLLKEEHIHHVNGDPKDNRIENLMIVSQSEHMKLEYEDRRRYQKSISS